MDPNSNSNYAFIVAKNPHPRGKQPRNLQDRSKYKPHQNRRECYRRLKQICEGRLDAHPDTIDKIINIATEAAKKVLAVPEATEDQTNG